MRAHPQAVIAYAAIKRSLAEAIPDLDTYAEVKDPIVDLVIVVAEEWARDTGWSTSTSPTRGADSGNGQQVQRPFEYPSAVSLSQSEPALLFWM